MLQPTSLLGGGDILVKPKSGVVEGSRVTVEHTFKISKNLEVVPRQYDGLDNSPDDANAETISMTVTVDDDRAKNISIEIVENNQNVVPRQNDGLDNSLENDATHCGSDQYDHHRKRRPGQKQ